MIFVVNQNKFLLNCWQWSQWQHRESFFLARISSVRSFRWNKTDKKWPQFNSIGILARETQHEVGQDFRLASSTR